MGVAHRQRHHPAAPVGQRTALAGAVAQAELRLLWGIHRRRRCVHGRARRLARHKGLAVVIAPAHIVQQLAQTIGVEHAGVA